jgi:hypothetical protein
MTDEQQAPWRTAFDGVYFQAHQQALAAEYEYLAQEVARFTGGAVVVNRFVAAVADVARQEGRDHLLVDGVPVADHHHLPTWEREAAEPVQLSRRLRASLFPGGRGVSHGGPTVGDVVQAVREARR